MSSVNKGKHTLGKDFARVIAPAIGHGVDRIGICIDLVDAVTAYHKTVEDMHQPQPAAQDGWERRCNKRKADIEQRITELVASLPDTPYGPVKAEFKQDPRGPTVRLVMPKPYHFLHDPDNSFESLSVPRLER